MYKIIMSIFFISTIFTLKPFINGLGCDFNFHQNNSMINYKVTCKHGFILSDFYDKITERRVIRRSIYGYWGGFFYKIPFYKKIHTNTDSVQKNISLLSRYELLNVWSASLFMSDIESKAYFLIKDHQGVMLTPEFNEQPKYGFIE